MAAEALTDMNDDFLLYSITERFVKEAETRTRSHDTVMQFAWCMVRSPDADHIRRGLDLIRRLLECQLPIIEDIQVYKRCYYILAVGRARLKDYPGSLESIENLRRTDPEDNQTWRELQKAIMKQRTEEGSKGGLVAGLGVGLVVGIVAALALRFLMK